MRAIACMLLLAACETRGTPVCFEDEFDTLDGRWSVMNPASTAVSATGRLVVALPENKNTNEGIERVERFDLRDGFVVAEVSRYVEPTAATQSEFVVRLDIDNQIFIGATFTTEPVFMFRLTANAMPSEQTAPFRREVRFWRVRAVGAQVAIESSEDGMSWLMRRIDPAPFALDAVTVLFEADAYGGGIAQPGALEVERVLFASPSCDASDREPAPHL